MSTLCDRFLRYGLKRPVAAFGSAFAKTLANATVVNVDNIAEYFFTGTPQEQWDIYRDFPSVAPPWEDAFLEYRMPDKVVSEETGVTKVEFRYSVGIRLVSRKVTDIIEEHQFGEAKELAFWRSIKARGVRWTTAALLMLEQAKGKIYGGSGAVWGVMEDGRPVGLLGEDRAQLIAPTELKRSAVESNGFPPSLYVAALAYCFCNCSKTIVIPHTPDERLLRAYRKRTGHDLVRYNTVQIEAVNKVLKSAATTAGGDLKQALHICRGHFKDYRERGLFGKIKGVFWWDMAVRGSVEHGTVIKEYEAGKIGKKAS